MHITYAFLVAPSANTNATSGVVFRKDESYKNIPGNLVTELRALLVNTSFDAEVMI